MAGGDWVDAVPSCLPQWVDSNRLRTVAIVVGVLVALLVGGVVGSDIFIWMTGLTTWFRNGEPWTIFLYCAIFVVGIALFLPYSPMCIAIGFVYGPLLGMLVQTLANTLGSWVTFELGKRYFRGPLVKYFQDDRLIRRVESTVGDPKTTVRLNVLLCFAPLPFALHVHLFAVADAPTLPFVASFVVGMMPNTMLFLLTGHALFRFAAAKKGKDDASTFETIGLIAGVIGTLALVLYMASLVRKELEAAASGGLGSSVNGTRGEEASAEERGGLLLHDPTADDDNEPVTARSDFNVPREIDDEASSGACGPTPESTPVWAGWESPRSSNTSERDDRNGSVEASASLTVTTDVAIGSLGIRSPGRGGCVSSDELLAATGNGGNQDEVEEEEGGDSSAYFDGGDATAYYDYDG